MVYREPAGSPLHGDGSERAAGYAATRLWFTQKYTSLLINWKDGVRKNRAHFFAVSGHRYAASWGLCARSRRCCKRGASGGTPERLLPFRDLSGLILPMTASGFG